MYKKLLTKKFFRDNPYLENSVQQFVYSILLYKGIDDLASKIMVKEKLLSNERIEKIAQGNERIKAEQNPETIFQLLRKKMDMANRSVLIKKGLELEEVMKIILHC